MIATVLDTGPVAAALNAGDRRHAECASLLKSLPGHRLLPSPVMTEVCWLLERWPKVEAAFLAQVARGAFELVHLTPADLTRMGELVLQYADFPLGGVDASVIAVAGSTGAARASATSARLDARRAPIPLLGLDEQRAYGEAFTGLAALHDALRQATALADALIHLAHTALSTGTLTP